MQSGFDENRPLCCNENLELLQKLQITACKIRWLSSDYHMSFVM